MTLHAIKYRTHWYIARLVPGIDYVKLYRENEDQVWQEAGTHLLICNKSEPEKTIKLD